MTQATQERPKQDELPHMPVPKGAALKALKKSNRETIVVQSPETLKKYRFTVKRDEKLSVRLEPASKDEAQTEDVNA